MARNIAIAALLSTSLIAACSTSVAGEQIAPTRAPEVAPIARLDLLPVEPPRVEESVALTTTPKTTTSTVSVAVAESEAPILPPRMMLPTVPEPFEASPSEPYAEAKTIAGQIAQRLLTYDPDTAPILLAAEVAFADYQILELAAALRPAFHPEHWSRATVMYPQLGGLANERMSVMVVVRQMVGEDDGPSETVTRTMDVRLMSQNGEWVFDKLASSGGEPVPRPSDLSNLAARVIDHPNIELPDSARWDIYEGRISNSLLRLMADLGDQSAYGVVTLTTGHPHNVFETDNVSSHTIGRAVDVYRIGATRVIDGRAEGSPIHEFATDLCTQDTVSSIGSPWRIQLTTAEEQTEEQDDQYLCRSFTNSVHQDHIHISVVGSS